jgi:cytidylate kinase
MNLQKVIAIDGPSGSGKSTIAKMLAKNLDVLYIDTGAMYRAIACWCDLKSVDIKESPEFDQFIEELELQYGLNDQVLVQIEDQDLTQKIREHHISNLASIVSQIPSVRKKLLVLQRELGEQRVCVMEGRDIGSVVFPSAFVKFFVTASVDVRAQRRLNQLAENGDTSNTLEQIKKDVEERDYKDANRDVSPLIKSEDADLVDTSDLTTDQVIDLLREKVLAKAESANIQIQ